MGLDVCAKGLSEGKSYCCGYITYGHYLTTLAKAFNQRYGEIYEEWRRSGLPMTQAQCAEMNKATKDCREQEESIWLFISHSDCDGMFTPKECRKIYNAIKDIRLDMTGHNYSDVKPVKDESGNLTYDTRYYNMHEQWKGIYKHCADRRVNLYFR